MKKVKIFGKMIPVFLIAIFALGLVSATLLAYFGQVRSTINVAQAIVLEGENCVSNVCETYLETAGSETVYSNVFDIMSNTVNDLDVKFSNSCTPDCEGVTITNQVGVTVTGFSDPNAAFDSPHYKKSYYETPVSDLDNLDSVTYSFKITERTGFGDTVAPYVVIVSNDFPYGAAVYLIPDGETYGVDTNYEKTLNDDSRFHVPGDTHGCADQSDGCSLAGIKGFYPNAEISKISVAVGAFPGEDSSMTALMGIGKINGLQAEHKSVKIFGGSTVPTVGKYDFDALISPAEYVVSTSVAP